jgi:antitoxin component HigA of HigAB toxin-antitoxin module
MHVTFILAPAESIASIRRIGECHMGKIKGPLRSEADYNKALKEIERYFENEPKPDTPEADRFDFLATIIEDYERGQWPIEPPDPSVTR